jgi:hypothetical protein
VTAAAPDDRQRHRPASAQRHPERDGQHPGQSERVAEDDGGQQILRRSEQSDHPGTLWSGAFRQLPHPPTAQRQQRRLCEREEKTRAREQEDCCDCPEGRRFHSPHHAAKPGREKVKSRYRGTARTLPRFVIHNFAVSLHHAVEFDE